MLGNLPLDRLSAYARTISTGGQPTAHFAEAPGDAPMTTIFRLPPSDDAIDFIAIVVEVDGDVRVASIHALDELVGVGSLKWDTFDNGEIADVFVLPDWQHQGIATRMFRLAEHLAQQEGWHTPTRARIRTKDGDAWARSLGASPAECINEDPHGRRRS